jgi:hypothetical protein
MWLFECHVYHHMSLKVRMPFVWFAAFAGGFLSELMSLSGMDYDAYGVWVGSVMGARR